MTCLKYGWDECGIFGGGVLDLFLGRFTIFNCSGSNSLTIVVVILLSFWVCNSLFPSWVMIDFTLRPSGVSSSNSSLSLNSIDVFLNVECDDSTYMSSFLVSSTTGVTELPNLRITIPTPVKKKKKKKIKSIINYNTSEKK